MKSALKNIIISAIFLFSFPVFSQVSVPDLPPIGFDNFEAFISTIKTDYDGFLCNTLSGLGSVNSYCLANGKGSDVGVNEKQLLSWIAGYSAVHNMGCDKGFSTMDRTVVELAFKKQKEPREATIDALNKIQ